MDILVTGAKGFIGKNLTTELKSLGHNVFEYDINSAEQDLKYYCSKAEFIFHLAGINRPKKESEFMEGNCDFTTALINNLKDSGNKCPVLMSSSIQAELNNPYGESKKAGEMVLFDYAKTNKVKVFVYRLPNVFGKWCKPNYNCAIATFCYNIAHNKPITITDRDISMTMVYIDDVVKEFISKLSDCSSESEKILSVKTTYQATLGKITDLIYSFKESRQNLSIPDMSDMFTKNLYSTYLSYLPENEFAYPLKMNIDNRGSFTEILRTSDRGQFSVNISKTGITKGNHWHNTKNEKFVVVSGTGEINFRKINSDEIITYKVSGEKIEVIDIPVGYTHNIINTGKTDLVTFMWCNECFNKDNPDTYFLEV